MIKSYLNKGLELFETTGSTRKLAVQQQAPRIRRILNLLMKAHQPSDLNLPGYRWHPLGDMAPGRYSVTVNGNWRITFAWEGKDAIEVDLEDYH